MRKIIHRKSFVFCRQKMQQPQSQQKRVPVCRGCSSISRFTQMFSIYKFIFTSKQISSVLSCPRLAQRSNIHSALVFNFSLLLCLFLFSSDEESKYVRMRDSFCLALLVILFSPYLLELSTTQRKPDNSDYIDFSSTGANRLQNISIQFRLWKEQSTYESCHSYTPQIWREHSKTFMYALKRSCVFLTRRTTTIPFSDVRKIPFPS